MVSVDVDGPSAGFGSGNGAAVTGSCYITTQSGLQDGHVTCCHSATEQRSGVFFFFYQTNQEQRKYVSYQHNEETNRQLGGDFFLLLHSTFKLLQIF